MKDCRNLKMKNKKVVELRLSMFFDALITATGILGAMFARFWFEHCDWFLVCSLVACFSFNNLADSHEQYCNIIDERDKNF